MKLHRATHFSSLVIFFVSALDVIFLLMLFFVLNSSVIVQTGISVELPYSKFTLGLRSEPALITITAAPHPNLYFHNKKIELHELKRTLREKISKERQIIIKADVATPGGLIVEVMNQCLEAGFSVVLATSLPASENFKNPSNSRTPLLR